MSVQNSKDFIHTTLPVVAASTSEVADHDHKLSLLQSQDKKAHLIFLARMKDALDVRDPTAINRLADTYKASESEGDLQKVL